MMFEIHLGRVCLSRGLTARRRLKAGRFVATCFLIVSGLSNFFRLRTNTCARRESKILEMFVLGACHYSATVLAPPTLAPTLQRLLALAPVTLARPTARHGVLAPARSSFQRQDLKREYERTQFSIGKTIDGDNFITILQYQYFN